MIQLFASAFGEPFSDFQMKKYMNELSPEEQERILQYKNPEDRQRTLLASKMTSAILERYFDKKHPVQIKRDNMGRPYLCSEPAWGGDFNLSHSGAWILCAVANSGRVGIDVERIEPIDLSAAAYCFSDDECRRLFRQPAENQLHFFYERWTEKEALAKTVGVGLLETITDLKAEPHSSHTVKWNVKHYCLDREYLACLVSTEGCCPEEIVFLAHRDIGL